MMPSIIEKSIILLFLLIVAIFPNCGYNLQEAGKPVGLNIPSLAIPLMESTSSTLGFESDFTSVIREEFISHAKVPLVSRDEAAMVLIGKISEIETVPLSYRVNQTYLQNKPTFYEVTNSRRLKIILEAKLVERGTGKVVWEERDMEDEARFSVTADPLTNRYNEKKALQEIARRLADRIYLKTMERF